MGRFVSRKEFENAVQQMNHALFCMDIAIEVLAEHYCMANQEEFNKFCKDLADFKLKKANDVKTDVNDLNSTTKKKEE